MPSTRDRVFVGLTLTCSIFALMRKRSDCRVFSRRPVQHAQTEGGCDVSIGMGEEGTGNLQSGESEDHVMATCRLHAWLWQATGQAHLVLWRLARPRARVGGADVGIEAFLGHCGGCATRRAIACSVWNCPWSGRRPSRKRGRNVATQWRMPPGRFAVAGGARAALETPTPSDAGGRDVFTITHKNMTSEISFLMTRFQVQESLEFHVRSVLVSSVRA